VPLVPFLIVTLAVGGCAWPLSQTSVQPTPAPKFTCTPADTHNQVLQSGSLTVKAPYGDVLRYVDDAVRHPDGDLFSFWTNDVLAPNPELRQYVPSQQALAVTLGSATPDDFRCVVTDMERANAGQIALQALEHSTALLSGPPATLDLLPVPIASSDFVLFNFFTGASELGSIEVLCWEPAPSKRINSATAASRWATYIPATTLQTWGLESPVASARG
jgi:hypothetical protein